VTTTLRGLALLCAILATCAARGEDKDKTPVPVYTNDDLRRVSPLREETGGGISPAAIGGEANEEAARPERPERGAEYWQREAERLRDRLQPLRERAEGLRACIEERRPTPSARLRGDPRIESCRRRLRALEDRIKDAQDRFEERARRAGALPGWIR
jgi:hypothetical protein